MSFILHEAHYCTLQSQSNCYGLTKIRMPCGRHKILVASHSKRVIALDFQKATPSSKDVQFTYIPGDAEIVSMDAFNRSHHGSGVIIGITFIKVTENKLNQFLNIYSDLEPSSGADCNVDNIAQGCQNLELSFTPFHLYHTKLCIRDNLETVFLLSGEDERIHLYREEKYQHTFSEENIEEFFPEMANVDKIVTWMEVEYYNEYHSRLTVLGTMFGTILATCVEVMSDGKGEIVRSWSIEHDSVISKVSLFMLNTDVICPPFFNQVCDGNMIEDGSEPEYPDYQLLVTSSTELAVVYKNILDRGFSDPTVLPDGDRFDCVQCATIVDIDFDGYNEILLGTYGQELLAYKYHAKKPSSRMHSSSLDKEELSRHLDSPNHRSSANSVDGDFRLLWKKTFPDPIHAMDTVDGTGDGLTEVAVVSAKGLHLLQHDIDMVSDLCQERLQDVARRSQSQDDYTKLQAEPLFESDTPLNDDTTLVQDD